MVTGSVLSMAALVFPLVLLLMCVFAVQCVFHSNMFNVLSVLGILYMYMYIACIQGRCTK